MSDPQKQLAINKLIILFLVEKMEVPYAGSQISQFALERDYMDYFSIQQYLTELIDVGYLTKNKEENTTYYSITDEGSIAVSCLIDLLPDAIISEINGYIQERRKEKRSEFDVAANYFELSNNMYSVKCGAYESDGTIMMELNVVVMTREQAKLICNNWKADTAKLYTTIFATLSQKEEADDSF